MNGNLKERTEIVVDDRIPVDKKGDYLFGKPNCQLIWMILIEKALAKILRSYFNILNLSAGEIFEEVTGVPLINPSIIRYNRNFYLNSNKFEFLSEESMFFKFTIDHEVKIAFIIW